MKNLPTLKEITTLIANQPVTNIEAVYVHKTCSCGVTCHTDNKNGRTIGVRYRDGREVFCVYNY